MWRVQKNSACFFAVPVTLIILYRSLNLLATMAMEQYLHSEHIAFAKKGPLCARIGIHLFSLPNPQRWKPVLARGGSANSLNHNDFLLAFLR